MPTENIDDVRETLSRIYGAVAAVVRDDLLGSDVLLADLHDSFADFSELLAALSFATLDRLDAALATGEVLSPRERRAMAQFLLTEAHRYALHPAAGGAAVPVQSAARRLDAVRRHDHEQVLAEIEDARSVSSDAELLWGATALLAAVVAMWAQRSGQSPRRAAADLCLAVSVAATC
ncbi:MAG: hypothetical protein HZB15_09690 [Actinobacteria bacterium]|nr:hypothetical protein [Actinomycetota bacterium]